MRSRSLLLSFFAFFNLGGIPFEKVVIWGHKLHSHTHSYIHNAFFRAFEHLGHQTFWFDNNDDTKNFDFGNSLFLTEGQVDQNIPLREDCFYILHNCDLTKYKKLFEKNRCIILQVYTDDVLTRAGCEKIAPFMYYDVSQKIAYMPWATDLLPHEIDEIKSQLPDKKKRPIVNWVGSIWGGEYGNIDEIQPFKKACHENGINFQQKRVISPEENIRLIRESYMAPAIVGTWQKNKGYIPCRIFKNISYGHPGITNSRHVYELFEKKIIYNPDTYRLFYDAQKRMAEISLPEIYDLMDFVKTKHTYINRIQTLLDFFGLVQKAGNAQETEL